MLLDSHNKHLSITVENQDVAIIYQDKVMQRLRCASSGGRRKEKRCKEETGKEEKEKNPWYTPKT